MTVPSDLPRADDKATESLLRGLADDLDAGFVDLVRAYERVMFSVALRIGGKPVEAEDLVAKSHASRGLRTLGELYGYHRPAREGSLNDCQRL